MSPESSPSLSKRCLRSLKKLVSPTFRSSVADDNAKDDGQTYTLRVTFLEIYNERITDLLPSEITTEGTKIRPLDITGDDGKVSGLSAKSVTTADDVVRYLAEGDRRRRVGMTDWNERSSRSHSVFTVVSVDFRSGITPLIALATDHRK